jgi:hypothetical protein
MRDLVEMLPAVGLPRTDVVVFCRGILVTALRSLL